MLLALEAGGLSAEDVPRLYAAYTEARDKEAEVTFARGGAINAISLIEVAH